MTSARRWFLAVAAVAVVAVLTGWLGLSGSPIVVYPITDFSRLPVSAGALALAEPSSCGALRPTQGSARLVDAPCGSRASTYRVIGRVDREAQCVRDADLTLSWAAGGQSGALCLDYDWVAGQCLQISGQWVSKVDCTRRGAVQPEMAIIGGVDVSYCKESGIAHRARHFTICTLAGDKDCAGKPRGT